MKKYFTKKQENKTKQKDQKQRQKKFPTARVEPRTSALSIAPRQLILLTSRKLIVFNTDLPMKFCRSTLFVAVRALFMEN